MDSQSPERPRTRNRFPRNPQRPLQETSLKKKKKCSSSKAFSLIYIYIHMPVRVYRFTRQQPHHSSCCFHHVVHFAFVLLRNIYTYTHIYHPSPFLIRR
jgi:hypothetical protein